VLDQRRPGQPTLHPGARSEAGRAPLPGLLPGPDCRELCGGVQQVKGEKNSLVALDCYCLVSVL